MTVLVGYIPNPEGLAALDAATEAARQRGQRLVVVNTGDGGDYSSPLFATGEDVDAIDAHLSGAGVEHEIRRPVDGAPAASAILSVAAETGAELIVIGIRRRSPVGKLLLGSTAQRVLLEADCDVLAVRAKR